MFSVVVPVWNKEHTLERTLRSVLAQTYRDFELIVVDDGSADGSVDVLRRVEDRRVRLVRQPHAGAGPARNAGIAAARHDWIAFLDADDLWLPEHLAELDLVRSRHPEAGLIGTSFVESDREGRFHVPERQEAVIDRIRFFDRVARGENVLCSSSAAIRRNVWQALGGFSDAPSGQDSEYWARIALSWPVARSTRVTAVYIRGTEGITERAVTRWLGKELRTLADLAPAVALVTSRYGEIADPEQRKDVDRYVDRYLDMCVRASVAAGDVRTLRALPRIAPERHRRRHRVLLAVARLPAPVARGVYRLGMAAAGLLRRRVRQRH